MKARSMLFLRWQLVVLAALTGVDTYLLVVNALHGGTLLSIIAECIILVALIGLSSTTTIEIVRRLKSSGSSQT